MPGYRYIKPKPREFDTDTSQVGDVDLKVNEIKVMNLVKEVWNWLVYSSANPEKLALTLKAGVTFLVLFGLDQTIGDSIADNVVGLIFHVVQVITLAGLIWGAVRKIGVTVKERVIK